MIKPLSKEPKEKLKTPCPHCKGKHCKIMTTGVNAVKFSQVAYCWECDKYYKIEELYGVSMPFGCAPVQLKSPQIIICELINHGWWIEEKTMEFTKATLYERDQT